MVYLEEGWFTVHQYTMLNHKSLREDKILEPRTSQGEAV